MADTPNQFDQVQSAVNQPGIVNPFAPGYEPQKGAFSRGLSAGVKGLKASVGGVVAAAGDAVGLDSVKQYGLGVADTAMQDASKDAMRVEDVEDVGSAVDFAQYGIGYSIPNALAAIAAGALGRLGGGVLGKGVASVGEQMFLKNAGMTAGLAATGFAQEVGAIYPEAVANGVPDALARSVVGGATAAALDTVPEMFLAGKLGLLGKATGGPTSRVRNAVGTAAKSAVLEGGTEVAQTGIERLAAGNELTGAEANSDYLNAGALGALGGGAAGGITGAVAPTGQPTISPALTPQPAEQPTISPALTPQPVEVAPEGTPEQVAPRPLALDIPAEQMSLVDNSPSPASEVEQRYFATEARQQEITASLSALDTESKSTAKDRRPKQEIVKERAALTAELGQASQQLKNLEALIQTPDYQVRSPSTEPVILGDQMTATSEVQPLASLSPTPPFARTAEEVLAANRAPRIELLGGTGSPRAVFKQADIQAQREFIMDAGSKVTDTSVSELVTNGMLKSEKSAKTVSVALNNAVRSMLSAKDPEIAKGNLEDGVMRALKGKINKMDAQAVADKFVTELLRTPQNFVAPNLDKPLSDTGTTFYSKAGLDGFEKQSSGRIQQMIEQVDAQHERGEMTMDEYRDRTTPLISALVSAKNREAKAAKVSNLSEVFPGFKVIPDGTKIRGSRGTNIQDQMGVVVGQKVIRVLDEMFSYPIVDFGDGNRRTLSQFDIHEVYAPRSILESRAAMTPDQLDRVLTVKGQQAISYLERIIGNPENLQVRTFTASSPQEGIGSTRLSKLKDVIELATNAKDIMSLAAHEGFHYLEFRALNKSEQAVMKRAFAPGSESFNRLIARTRLYDEINKTSITDEILAVPAEARAYGFEFWRRGELDAPTLLGKIFDKFQSILEQVRNVIQGLGFQSHRDIFDAIDKGRYARTGGNPFRALNLDAEALPQDTLSLASRGALEDLALRARNGEVPTSQLHAKVADMIGDSSVPDGIRERLFRNGSGELRGAANSLTRAYMQNISSGLNLARHSAGYKNVFDVLTTFTQRKNRLIADNVDNRLSTWVKGASEDDKRAASAALLERTVNGYTKGSEGYSTVYGRLTQQQRAMFDQATAMIAHNLDEEFLVEQQTYGNLLGRDTENYREWFENRARQVEHLKEAGYFPERRYGDHATHAYIEGEDGKRITLYYAQHEREADARAELADIKQAFAGDPLVKTEYGYKYKADYDGSLSMQQFLDLANRNGISLTQEERERLAKSLVSADSTRRNRIFRRQNIAGYSQDGMRILAEYGVSMANKIAYGELGGAMNDAMEGRQVDTKFLPNGHVQVDTVDGTNVWEQDGEMGGFYRNLADRTADFVMSPREGSKVSSALRGAATVQFLGGSIAAGIVQLTSLPMNTVPWLTQHTGYTDAMSKVLGGLRTATAKYKELTDLPTLLRKDIRIEGVDEVEGLRDALTTAAQDGTTLDTEIYQIMGLSRGQEYSMSGRLRGAVQAWMTPFRVTEQLNRIATFVGAYKIAKEKNLDNTAAYKLAQDAVYGTQFRYDEANRPALARSPVGALLFTFRSYPIFVAETIAHLAKTQPKAAVFMLLSLSAFAGIEGLPFAEDIEDLIDTVAYRIFGSSFNSKRALRNVLKSASEAVVGADLSSVAMHGITNEITGMNFASRVGLGNILPGTRIGTPDVDYKSVVQEVAGPTLAMVTSWLNGIGSLTQGQYVEAMRQALPVAGQNAVKGILAAQKGFLTDVGGRKLVDVSGPEAFFQGLGFTPTALSRAYEADKMDKQTLAFYQAAKNDFTKDIVRAVTSGDKARVAEAVQAVTAWNRANPHMPIAISPSNMRKTIQQAGMSLDQRTFQSLPKGLRGSSETAIGLDED